MNSVTTLGLPRPRARVRANPGQTDLAEPLRRFAGLLVVLALLGESAALVWGSQNESLEFAFLVPGLVGVLGMSSRATAKAVPSTAKLDVANGLAFATTLIGVGIQGTSGQLVTVTGLVALGLLGLVPTSRPFPLILCAMAPVLTEIVANGQTLHAVMRSVACVLAVAIIWRSSGGIQSLLLRAAVGLSGYVTASVVLYVDGFRSPYSDIYTEAAAATFGPFSQRWRLPLATSWTTVPIVAVIGFLLCVWLLRELKGGAFRAKLPILVLSIAGAAVCLLAVLASDGRAEIEATVFAGIATAGLLRKKILRFACVALQLLWIAPVWWGFLLSNNNSLLGRLLSFVALSRGANDSAFTLEGRTTIWHYAWDTIANSHGVYQMFGWGPEGYITSGAALAYSSIFAGGTYANNTLNPPHDVLLQVLLGGGVVLAIVLGAPLVVLVRMGLRSPLRVRGTPAETGVLVLLATVPLLAFAEVATLPSNASSCSVVIPLMIALVLETWVVWRFESSTEPDRVNKPSRLGITQEDQSR